MQEPKTIAEFPKCSVCGSEETISQLATAPLKASGKIAQGTFTLLRQQVVPLEQPLLAAITVSCVVTLFDICAKCGTERCTLAQLIQAPVQMQPNPRGNGPGMFGGGIPSRQ